VVSGNPVYDSRYMDDEDIKREADPETKRLINLVKVTLRILGLSNREVARRLGMSPSYVSKLLSGAAEIRLDHVIRICRAADMEPAEFFGLAYPLPAARPSTTQARLRDMLQGIAPAPPPLPAKERERFTDKEIHDMLKSTLDRLLRGSGV
jgi:transcriptional regulator with XRE-family HTH domain